VSAITAATWVRGLNAYPVSGRDWGIVHPESDFSSIYDQIGDDSNCRPLTWTRVQRRGIGHLIIDTFDNIHFTL
jgi:hypothetical protein